MGKFVIRERDCFSVEVNGFSEVAVKEGKLEEFNSSLLGLGDISIEATERDCIAAMFDLEGFTNFCKQIEPQLIVPGFLQKFLDWIFVTTRDEMKRKNVTGGSLLWSPLPFYCKFLGDGLLFLWDSQIMKPKDRRNIIISAASILKKYREEFYPSVGPSFADVPPRLRCGLARGKVLSLGNGKDYVGSCINMAARLQKLPGLSFAFNRRGFQIESGSSKDFFDVLMSFRRVRIRGIGDNEVVGAFKEELDSLENEDLSFYRIP